MNNNYYYFNDELCLLFNDLSVTYAYGKWYTNLKSSSIDKKQKKDVKCILNEQINDIHFEHSSQRLTSIAFDFKRKKVLIKLICMQSS